MMKFISCALLIMIFVGGCSTQLLPSAPTVDIPKSLNQTSDSSPLAYDWWREFNDSKLNNLIEIALNENHSLAITLETVKQNSALLKKSQSSRMPTLDIGLNATSSKASELKRTTQRNITLDAQYEIDFWGKLSDLEQQQRWNYRQSKSDALIKANTVAANTAIWWHRWNAANEAKRLIEEQLHSAHKRIKLIELQFSLGQLRASDLLQEKELLSSIETSRIEAETQALLAKSALALWLGENVDQLPEPPQQTLPRLTPVTDYYVDPAIILERPDVQSALAQLNAETFAHYAAKKDRLPSLTLSAQSIFSGSSYQTVLTEVIGSLLMPIFDGGNRIAEIDRAFSVQNQAEHNYRQAVKVASTEVLDNIRWDLDREATVEQIELQVRLLQSTEFAQAAEYRHGLTRYQDLIATQRRRVSVQVELINTQLDWVVRRINFFRSITQGPSPEIAILETEQ